MSLNDPNWGRGSRGPQGPGGGNQGPPDLDELWRNFNRRLSELFGRRRRGGDEPPTPPSSWQIGGGAGVLVALIVLVWLASGFFIVVEGQRGIVLTFGRFSQETSPGLRWRLPWPIQSHEIVNLAQVRTLEVGYRNNVRTKVLRESLMLTDDENIVDLQFAVQYLVKDARDYVFNVRRPDESAMQIAETAMREVIGKSTMDAILYETQVDVANRTRDLMQSIHDRYGTGIQVSTVTIQNAQPPEQVQAAFDDAVKAGQDRERQKNEGQAYANDVIPRARGTASRLQQEAEGYRQRVMASAEGDASRFRAGALGVRQGARRHARAHLHRDHAAGPELDQQGHDGLPRQRKPAVPAARSADAERGRTARGRRRGAPDAGRAARRGGPALARDACATETGRDR